MYLLMTKEEDNGVVPATPGNGKSGESVKKEAKQ